MIDWMAFVIVFVASIVSACLVVSLYAFGIRFLATPGPKRVLSDGSYEPDGPERDDEHDDVEETGRPRWATAAAYVCFALAGSAVLIGIYLIVPALHR